MGIANDALSWPQGFIDLLVDAGYQVIRYDYRGTGMSDWMPDWEEAPYSLTRWFANMGHDLPPSLYEALIAELSGNFEMNPN